MDITLARNNRKIPVLQSLGFDISRRVKNNSPEDFYVSVKVSDFELSINFDGGLGVPIIALLNHDLGV